MTILFIDSFDYYDDDGLDFKYSSNSFASINTTIGVPRNGSNGCLAMGTSISNVSKTFNTLRSQIIIGFAIKGVALGGNLFSISRLGQTQLTMVGTSGGDIEFHNGRFALNHFGTIPGAMVQVGVWNYFEIKIVVDSIGSIEFRKNGEDLTSTFILGDSTATWASDIVGNTPFWNTFSLHSNAGKAHYYDDLYLMDPTTGSAPQNDFLGDVLIFALKPDGPSATGWIPQWNPQPDTNDNYENIDEDPPDEDATYNFSNVPGSTDIYAFEDLSISSGLIFGVQTNMIARKAGGGTKIVQDQIRIGNSNYTGEDHYLSLEYNSFETFHPVNPNTGLDWESQDINDAEFGIKLDGFLVIITDSIPFGGDTVYVMYPTGLSYLYDGSMIEIASARSGGYNIIRGTAVVVVMYF